MLNWIKNLFLIIRKLNMFGKNYMQAIKGDRKREREMDNRVLFLLGNRSTAFQTQLDMMGCDPHAAVSAHS